MINIKKGVLLGTILCTLVSSTVLADSGFSKYYLKNTGYRYNGIGNSANSKTTTWDNWYVKAGYIRYRSNSSKAKALCFTPMNWDKTYYIAGGSFEWLCSSDDEAVGDWKGKGRKKTYYLGVRTDSDFSGNSADVTGRWNADY